MMVMLSKYTDNDDQKDNKVHLQIQLPMLVLEVGILDCLMEKINLSQNPYVKYSTIFEPDGDHPIQFDWN